MSRPRPIRSRLLALLALAAWLAPALVTPIHLALERDEHEGCPACAGRDASPSLATPCHDGPETPCENPSHRHHSHPVHDDDCAICRCAASAPAVATQGSPLPDGPVAGPAEAAPLSPSPSRDTLDPSRPPRAPPSAV